MMVKIGRQAGLSLVELMVSLTIGLFLLAGAVTVFGKTRDLYRSNETAARLQDTARYALSQIEADLRMANHFGLNSRPDLIERAARPGDPLDAEIAPFAAVINGCGDRWAVNLTAYVEGLNNGYGLACAPAALPGGAVTAANADVLTVRRAGATIYNLPAEINASVGRFRVLSSRVQGMILRPDDVAPIGGHVVCATPPNTCLTQIRPLLVHSYYVHQNSDRLAGFPSLRRKALGADPANPGQPALNDEEISAGIEDLQFTLGVDMNGDLSADYYVNPNVVIPASQTVVAVRIWLLARADQPDFSFVDNRNYQYGDRPAFTPNDNFRRLLVSKTISLRNTRR